MKGSASSLRYSRPGHLPLLLALLSLLQVALPATASLDPAAPRQLRATVGFLADDSLEGRESGTRGAAVAAEWLRFRFRQLRLEPLEGNYFHEFPAEPIRIHAEQTYFELGAEEGSSMLFAAGSDFMPHPGAPQGKVEGPLVFAGYGISAPGFDYDDLSGVSFEGAIALVLRWEPRASEAEARFDGRNLTGHAQLATKVAQLSKRGARAVLVASPPALTQEKNAPGHLWWPQHSRLFDQVVPLVRAQADPLDLAKTNFSPQDVANQFFSVLQTQAPLHSAIPVAFLGQDLLQSLFQKSGQDLATWIQEVDIAGAGTGFPLLLPAKLAITWHAPERLGRNVAALLPGTDPSCAKEIVLVSAHYDHVGKSNDGSIWNGADDNASGVAGLLAIAESLAKDPPRRPVLFLATDAEELGLLGAAHFLAAAPATPLPCAALNLDMIGRSKQGAIQILGSHSSPDFRQILDLSLEGLELHPDFENEEFFERSDHAVFYRAGIPVLFLNTGEHSDYHTPEDGSGSLYYERMSAITTFATRLTRRLATIPKTPRYQDGYARQVPVFGRSPRPIITWRVDFEDRLDF